MNEEKDMSEPAKLGSVEIVSDLTEERIREIVRDELTKWQASKRKMAKLVDVIGLELERRMRVLAGRARG